MGTTRGQAIPDFEDAIQKERLRRMEKIHGILCRALRAKSLDRPDIRRTIAEAERLSFFSREVVENEPEGRCEEKAIALAKRRAKTRGEPYIIATFDGLKFVVMPKRRLRGSSMGFKKSNVVFDTDAIHCNLKS